ncbi:MAG TPA: hypothetical protein VLR88_10820 [Propionibacteriaceae bacterium]|nr:hypothetical protein [Propionibacteriaceae bacterium]
MRWRLIVFVTGLFLLVSLVGCGSPVGDEPFVLAAVPRELKGASIPGQKVVFLVTVAEGAGPSPEVVSASAEGADVRVEGADVGPGDDVAEVSVTPDPTSVGGTVSLTIVGSRGQASNSVEVTFEVLEGEDDRAGYAADLRDRFVGWLAENRPELGIALATQWDGTMVSPQWLVVSHYLFFSPEWEMHVSWHIMIAPDDWARIDLRPRFRLTAPSLAFEIPTVSLDADPQPSEVPEEVWR